jgi:hypothetical protein
MPLVNSLLELAEQKEWQFIHLLMPPEYKYSGSKDKGPTTATPKHKMLIFSKITLMISVKFRSHMETISVNKAEQVVSSWK